MNKITNHFVFEVKNSKGKKTIDKLIIIKYLWFDQFLTMSLQLNKIYFNKHFYVTHTLTTYCTHTQLNRYYIMPFECVIVWMFCKWNTNFVRLFHFFFAAWINHHHALKSHRKFQHFIFTMNRIWNDKKWKHVTTTTAAAAATVAKTPPQTTAVIETTAHPITANDFIQFILLILNSKSTVSRLIEYSEKTIKISTNWLNFFPPPFNDNDDNKQIVIPKKKKRKKKETKKQKPERKTTKKKDYTK